MASGTFINRSIFTPTIFPGLRPHLQTEAILLAREFGLMPAVVAESITLPVAAVRAIMGARHAYRLPDAAAAEKEPYVDRPSNRHRIAALIFRLGGMDQPVSLSVTTIMASLDISNSSATRALRQMLTDKWILRASASSPVEAAAYTLTEIGAIGAEEAM